MSTETQTQGVTTETPPTPQTAVNDQPAETTAQETSATTETIEQTQGESETTTQTSNATQIPLNAELYDERGVPWKNVALEHRRKFDETQANLPKLIAEEVAKIQQPAQRKYTVAELEKFAQESPEHRPWVEEEKAKILREDISREFDAKIQATTKTQQEAVIRRESFNRVINEYPQLALKDQTGNFLGWNNLDPMTHHFATYMSRPEFQVPGGDVIAAKCAFADVARSQSQKTGKTMQSLKQQVRKAQAGTFVEGGGRKPGAENPNKRHLDALKQSGKIEDGAGVFKNIFRARGEIKE